MPGLAEARPEDVQALDLQAARVAYFVDGDEAGRKLRARLEWRGVSPNRIISLPEGHVLEDLVDPAVLVAALNEELRRSGREVSIAPNDLPATGRAAWIESQLQSVEIEMPSKPRLAIRVNELRSPAKDAESSSRSVIDRTKLKVILKALGEIEKALAIEKQAP